MSTFAKFWNGNVFGTNTGNLSLELTEENSAVEGKLKVADNNFGLALYDVVGTYDGTNLNLTGTPTNTIENVEQGNLTISGTLSPRGEIRGTWSADIGTGGTFVIHPFEIAQTTEQANQIEQLYTKVIAMGAIQLFGDDIKKVIAFVGKDFKSSQVVVTHNEGSQRVAKFADKFLNDLQNITSLDYIKINVQEPEGQGINKVLSIELRAHGDNDVLVQGSDDAWVRGTAEMTAEFLRPYQDGFRTHMRKVSNVTFMLIFISMTVYMTYLTDIKQKITLGLGVFLTLVVVPKLIAKYIPNAIIKISEEKTTVLQRFGYKLGTWAFALGSFSVVYYFDKLEPLLRNYLPFHEMFSSTGG